MATNQIDTLDEQILAALQVHGRLTMKALAEKVGLSSPAMIERVRRLEERGIITSYRAIVNPAALGRPLTALIFAEVDHPNLAAFIGRVQAEPAVMTCDRTAGVATFVVKVNVPDTETLEALVDTFSATGAHCTTSLVLSSPVPWQAVTPPAGSSSQRARATRRRRNANSQPAAAQAAAPGRRPGRPRGQRASQ